MQFGEWQGVIVDSGSQISDLIDLGGDFQTVVVTYPVAIFVGGAVSVEVYADVAGTDGGPVHALNLEATGSFLQVCTATGVVKTLVFFVGGAQYIKVDLGGNQSVDRDVWVRGGNLMDDDQWQTLGK